MRSNRRNLLAAGATLFTTTGLAGCSTILDDGTGTSTEPSPTDTTSSTQTEEPSAGSVTANAAVAAEWNAMRARLWDALALGVAGDTSGGASIAQQVFARFEGATGEYGAHETLEATSESNYEEFEEALGELRTAGLEAGNIGRAREETTIASTQLAAAQGALVGETTAQVLDLQVLGVTMQNAAFLASAGDFEAARTTASNVFARFEESAVHDVLESTDAEIYESFDGAIESVVTGAENEDNDAVQAGAAEAFNTALDGSYAIADAEAAAGAGHIATLQAQGWDAAALAGMGGPSTAFAHAAALTIYRARAYDCHWLASRGETDRAATMASEIFAHFEGARAHEALEEADHEAYEGFEGGLADLQSAIENEDSAGIDDAVAAIDTNLVTGIEVLAGGNAALLGSSFFRVRFADARELYRLGHSDVAASITQGLFQRFEANELDFHETVESTSEDLYHRFEEEHLASLVDAYENENDTAVQTHHDGVQSALLEFETMAGSTATVSGAEAAYMAARGFDAACLDTLGQDDRAQAIAQAAFGHFESGAGGYHETLEAADESTYEAFEEQLGAIGTAAGNGEDVYPVVKQFNAEVLNSVYAIVGSAGGSFLGAAASIMQDVFAHFEEARVHELLERGDRDAYEGFEAALNDYLGALNDGSGVDAAAEAFATAALRAQFAVPGAIEDAPVGATSTGVGSGEEMNLEGGPNVVEGVPDDADHVVQLQAVTYEPAEVTIQAGDTVAWEHAAGEPHTVTAYEAELPEGATYWASGGFESEQAARDGWENDQGAVQSGQSYVHTFETTGEHGYFCVPHEAASMTGTIIVD